MVKLNFLTKNIVPSMWMRCIINHTPNDNTLDPRDPMSYK